jgi:hypothetical protein
LSRADHTILASRDAARHGKPFIVTAGISQAEAMRALSSQLCEAFAPGRLPIGVPESVSFSQCRRLAASASTRLRQALMRARGSAKAGGG